MSMGDNIKQLRVSHNLTQEELAKIVGVSGKAVSFWELGTHAPRMGTIQKMADYFGVSKSYIIEGSGGFNITQYDNIFPLETKKIPLLGNIAAGEPIMTEENFESYVELGADINVDFALRVKGDSMIEADIKDGDVVFIKQQPQVYEGDVAAVAIDGEVTLKRFRQEGDTVYLLPANQNYLPIIVTANDKKDIRIIGKAIAFQRDIK